MSKGDSTLFVCLSLAPPAPANALTSRYMPPPSSAQKAIIAIMPRPDPQPHPGPQPPIIPPEPQPPIMPPIIAPPHNSGISTNTPTTMPTTVRTVLVASLMVFVTPSRCPPPSFDFTIISYHAYVNAR